VAVATCTQCGAQTAEATCEELFERLLALDHSRQPPWGPLHGVAVACFFLQHPDHPLAPHGRNDPRWAVLQAYLAGGQQALNAMIAVVRRRNSHRHRRRDDQDRPLFYAARPMPEHPAPTAFGTTIVDVAVDGSFPARGYELRVRAWAEGTFAAWAGYDGR